MLASLLLITLCSCSDTSELTKRDRQLEAQIKALQNKLDQKSELLRSDLVDVGEEIEAVNREIKVLKSDIARMEALLVELRDDKDSLELRFNHYRTTYTIR